MKPEQVHPLTTTLIERYHSVLYPLPLERLLDILPTKGWLVPFLDRDATGVKLSEPVSKGNVRLMFDRENKTLGVRAIDPGETLEAFEEIEDLVAERFKLAPEVQTHYLELRCVGILDSGSSREAPAEALSRWWSGHPQAESMIHAMEPLLPNERLSVYGLRFATAGKDPNRPNWAEMTITPAASGVQSYQFDVIYRQDQKEPVKRVTASIRELVATAIEGIEQ